MSANLTKAECRQRANTVRSIGYRVSIDVRDAGDQAQPSFPTVSELTLESVSGERFDTWLDFVGESVESVTVDGNSHPFDWDGARITLTGLPARARVEVRAHGRYSRSGEGLHRFFDPADDTVYLYTQYEPADARRVFANMEQPDLKASYTFSLTVPTGWHALSNRAAASTTHAGDTTTVEFLPTKPISTYITALAAGPYTEVRDAHNGIDLAVYCRASLAEHFDADNILRITKQGLDFFQPLFGDYPWGKYDQIFVPEYNLGAMENPGLVTFTEQYVFRGAATRAQFEGRANTILHEMAHMWFGDLVTMRWWDDLWLKESFADFCGSDASVEATEFTNAWASFANRRKAWAYQQDQLPTTHPIVADIPDLEAAKLNFDGITYAKGASVLKQLVAYVGRDAFFAGAKAYFDEHAYGNTTLDDLLAELSRASGRDLTDWAAAWLQTSGVTEMWREGNTLVQSPARPHRLAVGSYELRGDRLVRAQSKELDVTDERTEFAFPDADLTIINDGDLSYVKARLDDTSLATIEAHFDKLDDQLARALVWSQLWNATRDGMLHPNRYLAIATRCAGSEPNVGLQTAVLENAHALVSLYLPQHERGRARRALLDAARAGLLAAEPGSGAQLVFARAFAANAAYDDAYAAEIRAMLDGESAPPAGLPMDADLRWRYWVALAATGHAERAALDAELERDRSSAGRTAHIEALAAAPSRQARDAAFDAALGDERLSNDHLSANIAGCTAGGRRDLTSARDADYYAQLRTIWRDRSIEIARRIVVGLFPYADSLDDVDAWLANNTEAPGALRRLMLENRDQLRRALHVREQAAG